MSHRRTFDPQTAKSTPPVWNNPRRACKDVDPEVFYPEHATGYPKALAVCGACPADIRARCLAWAIETVQSFGVIGGTTPDQRHRMIKNAGGEAA